MTSVFDPLIALSRRPITMGDIKWLLDQLNTTQSDAHVAIVAGSFVEAVLRDTILQHLVESKTRHQNLFQRNGPLSNFDAQISIAYGIGLISKEMRHDLTIIRHVRNAFAHAPRQLSFASPEISPVCESFHNVKKDASPGDTVSNRSRFVAGTKLLVIALLDMMMRKAGGLPSRDA